MKFHPEDKKIKDIFGSGNIYSIPNFQRDYSWETENFEDFLDDLLEASKADYNNNNFTLSINNLDNLEDYFFGTFLVIGDYASSSEPRVVVDGQQRLTTMTLFLAAIRTIIDEISIEKDIQYEHTYEEALVFNLVKNGKSSKVARVVNEKLNPILPVNILNINDHLTNGAKHTPENESQKLTLEIFEWFKTQLSRIELANRLNKKKLSKKEKEKVNEIPDEKYLNFIDNLGNQLLHSTVIIIYSEDEESANIMYRNFNFRGIPLSGPDLMKNEIFQILDDSTGTAKKSWGDIEKNISMNESSNLSTFFIHYFSSSYQLVSKKNLFSVFLKNIDSRADSYTLFLQDLIKESTHYRIMIQPRDEDKLFGVSKYFIQKDYGVIQRHLWALNQLEVTQVRTILLGIFFAMDNNLITSKQFKKLIKNILLFQSLIVMTTSPANILRSMYSKYARLFRNIQRESNDSQRIIKDFYVELEKKLPSQQLVLKSDLQYDHRIKLTDMKSIDKKHRTLIKLVLTILSENYHLKHSVKAPNDALKFISDASLEHIIDQSTDFGNRFSIGNLILLEQDKHHNNINKKETYENSKILMTQKFSQEIDSFTSEENIEENIDTRKKEILKEYYNYVIQQLQC